MREYGPFPQAENTAGVTHDGHHVWVAVGSSLLAFDPASGEPQRRLACTGDAGTAFDGTHRYQIAEARIDKIAPPPAPSGARTMLLFDLDSDNLSGNGRAALTSVADSLKRLGVTRVRVDGHTDSTGSARHNLVLSRRRAEAAAQGLVRSGIADRSIERRGFGEEKPVADNKTPEGRAQNRRVVITLVVD